MVCFNFILLEVFFCFWVLDYKEDSCSLREYLLLMSTISSSLPSTSGCLVDDVWRFEREWFLTCKYLLLLLWIMMFSFFFCWIDFASCTRRTCELWLFCNYIEASSSSFILFEILLSFRLKTASYCSLSASGNSSSVLPCSWYSNFKLMLIAFASFSISNYIN